MLRGWCTAETTHKRGLTFQENAFVREKRDDSDKSLCHFLVVTLIHWYIENVITLHIYVDHIVRLLGKVGNYSISAEHKCSMH